MSTRHFRKMVSILILVLAVLIITGGCATRKKAISETDFFEAYSGTWINTDYSGDSWGLQKKIHFPDGRWEEYSLVTLSEWSKHGKDTIGDMWTDSNGDIWYKASWEDSHNQKGYTMGKISDSGNTLEILFRNFGEPIEEWDLDNIHYHYVIHYRQE